MIAELHGSPHRFPAGGSFVLANEVCRMSMGKGAMGL
jgi:hypothetical protein